jgi:hypothetical protein
MTKRSDEILRQRFVATFEKLDKSIDTDRSITSNTGELQSDGLDDFGYKPKPVQFQTVSTAIDLLYQSLPLRFPPLFEKLLLSYRWPEVDLGRYRLAANLPGSDLSGFFNEISRDQYLWETLISAKYLPFGKGSNIDYDPVCFDTASRTGRKRRIVKIDHEEILCNSKIKIVSELAPSFLDLVLQTLAEAKRSAVTHTG